MKIINFIPLPYSNSGNFWSRDMGLLTLAMRSIGIDSYLAAIYDRDVKDDLPLIIQSRNLYTSPEWWIRQKPDAIILNTWSAPRHDDIRRAALATGCPVIEKLDTDGVKSPRVYPWHSLRRTWVNYDLRHPISSGIPEKAEALARFFITYLFPSLLDKKMVRCMERVSVYAAETPLASARVRRFLEMYQASPMPRVVTIPHPVNTSSMGFASEDRKLDQIIAVGRWDDAVKGWPLLKRIVKRFLERNPSWRFLVAGPGAEEDCQSLQQQFEGRFQMLGKIGHDQLNGHLRASKIYLLTSHSETFNIAGAEALCCGCSVVGPGQIPSTSYFAGHGSGTVSNLRSLPHMLDALNSEVSLWEDGMRDPSLISRRWIEELGAQSVARRYLKVIESMADKPTTGYFK